MAPSPDPAEPPKRYHGAAIALHWLLAALLMFQFALGLRLDTIAAGGAKFTTFQFHKSIGIAVLLLSCARLGLWLLLPRPVEVGPSGQRLAARAAHWAFYAIMIFAPLSGWIIVSTAKLRVPTVLFGLARWPHLPLPAGFNQPAVLVHTVLSWSLPALIALHVAAVIYHLRKRDEVPGRMLPASIPGGAGLAGGLALLALAGWLGLGGPIPDLWSHKSAAVAASLPLPGAPPYRRRPARTRLRASQRRTPRWHQAATGLCSPAAVWASPRVTAPIRWAAPSANGRRGSNSAPTICPMPASPRRSASLRP